MKYSKGDLITPVYLKERILILKLEVFGDYDTAVARVVEDSFNFRKKGEPWDLHGLSVNYKPYKPSDSYEIF